MGTTSQLYSLSWGEFGSSLASTVQVLRGHGDLVDVTLAAGGRTFPAHKIVLSAASPFLLDLLKSTPCQHPVVMLAGIGADDLESLLEFIYRGEVSVEPSQLPSLLQAAHCLTIHGLSPPNTVLTESDEVVTHSSLVSCDDSLSRDAVTNTYVEVPQRRRKRKRKTSSGIGKWPRTGYQTSLDARSLDEHSEENRSIDFISKDDDHINLDEEAKEQLEQMNHHIISPTPHQLVHPVTDNCQSQMVTDVDSEPHLHDLMPMQPYSPLHIPQFPGSNVTYTTPTPQVSSANANLQNPTSTPLTASVVTPQSTKIRGASDCPGVCPLCGATLRQARNLRRHLLSSCKYRFTANSSHQMITDTVTIEVKPDEFIPVTTGTESGGNSCEQIVCNPSPLPSPSPQGSNVVSPHSNIPSPTVAR